MPSTAVTPAPAARPRIERRDVWSTVGYAALVVLLAFSGVNNQGLLYEVITWPVGVSVAVLLVASLGTLWRRSLPLVTLVITGSASLAEILLGGQITGYILLFDAFFVPILHGSRRLARATTALAVALTVAGLVLAATLTASPGHVLLVLLVATLVVLVPLMWGWEVRHHRDARQAAETLADAEHELAATRSAHAVEQERRRIAHDLHDVIAGHLSAVTLHTGLAASLEDEETRNRSLSTARESARAALRDLQSMIGVLATEEEGQLPVATLDWDSLAERLRGRDPDARVEIDPAATDPSRVEPSAQAALLRIAAEAVTNAVRHGAAPISLLVEVRGEDVSLVLENRRAANSRPGTGVGRRAIMHRAQAVGGSAGSGPASAAPPTVAAPPTDAARPTGGHRPTGATRPSSAGPPDSATDTDLWRVEARLPVRPLTPATSQETPA